MERRRRCAHLDLVFRKKRKGNQVTLSHLEHTIAGYLEQMLREPSQMRRMAFAQLIKDETKKAAKRWAHLDH